MCSKTLLLTMEVQIKSQCSSCERLTADKVDQRRFSVRPLHLTGNIHSTKLHIHLSFLLKHLTAIISQHTYQNSQSGVHSAFALGWLQTQEALCRRMVKKINVSPDSRTARHSLHSQIFILSQKFQYWSCDRRSERPCKTLQERIKSHKPNVRHTYQIRVTATAQPKELNMFVADD